MKNSNTKKKSSHNYLKIGDSLYERIECKTKMITFDFEEGVLKKLDSLWKKEGFVSRNEYIRHIIRNKLIKKSV